MRSLDTSPRWRGSWKIGNVIEPTRLTDRPAAKIFILGAPRSGTTWLQELLGSHPAIATSQELKLVQLFLGPLCLAWDDQPFRNEEHWREHRFVGLACVLDEREFLNAVRGFAEACYQKVLSLKPGAYMVLDKDPPNSVQAQRLTTLFPDAKFVHLIRDGREVAASLVSASAGWGGDWAPARVGRAARRWRKHVESNYGARSSQNYYELRYESLQQDPGATLHDLLDFLGVDASEDLVAQMQTTAEQKDALKRVLVWDGEVKARGYEIREPSGFRGGTTRKWTAWTPHESAAFNAAAGELLSELGYADGSWPDVGRRHRVLANSSERLHGLFVTTYLTALRSARPHRLARDGYLAALRPPPARRMRPQQPRASRPRAEVTDGP